MVYRILFPKSQNNEKGNIRLKSWQAILLGLLFGSVPWMAIFVLNFFPVAVVFKTAIVQVALCWLVISPIISPMAALVWWDTVNRAKSQ